MAFPRILPADVYTLVPAQAWFGPAAYITYRIMRSRYGRERTMKEFEASADLVHPRAPIVGPAALPAVVAAESPISPAPTMVGAAGPAERPG